LPPGFPEQLTLRAGFDFIRLGQQVRGVGQCWELFAGPGVFGGCGFGQLLLGADALNVTLGEELHLPGQLRHACFDLWGLGLLTQALALRGHVGVLTLEVKAKVLLPFGYGRGRWLLGGFWGADHRLTEQVPVWLSGGSALVRRKQLTLNARGGNQGKAGRGWLGCGFCCGGCIIFCFGGGCAACASANGQVH
jgi:hypothetical protein